MLTRTAPTGSNAERSRAYNRGLVLDHIRHQGTAGRAEIARASGLSTQAVSNIIADLVADGWLYEAGRREGQRGLPAVTYAIRAQAATALGIEIRPNAILGALIDLDGRVLFSDRAALGPGTAPRDVLPMIAAMLARSLISAGEDRASLLGAGVVMPGPFGLTGLTGQATELAGWDRLDPVAAISDHLDVPVTVENDANAAAMAERVSGAAQGLKTYAYLYFGTGLGLGMVVDGALYRGAFGNAGEIGHIPVPTPGGTRALEDVASRLALVRALSAAGLPAETIDDLDRARAAAAPAYRAWKTAAAAALAYAAHVIENLFDPETIILGGALPAGVLADLAEGIVLPGASVAHRADRALPRLIPGRAGRMIATIGAAALVVNTSLSPRLTPRPDLHSPKDTQCPP